MYKWSLLLFVATQQSNNCDCGERQPVFTEWAMSVNAYSDQWRACLRLCLTKTSDISLFVLFIIFVRIDLVNRRLG